MLIFITVIMLLLRRTEEARLPQAHDCDLPTSSGSVFPPPWRCPECDTLWVPQDEAGTAEVVPEGREVREQVSWTWRRFEELTPG